MQLSDIKGIKEKRLEVLTKSGIYTPVDLISFFPKKYLDITNLTALASVKDGDEVLLLAKTDVEPTVSYIRRNMSVVKIKFTYDFKSVYVTYYNQPYMAKNIVVGKYYLISGKIKTSKGYVIPNATLIPYVENSEPIPVYNKIKGLPSSVLTSAIDTVLNSVTLSGYIPKTICDSEGLMEINDAYKKVHHPHSLEEIHCAKRSVSIEYLNYLISVYSIIRKKNTVNIIARNYDRKSQFFDFIKALPFDLTDDQQKAINEICADMMKGNCNRLLQGDVGCGKTVVALACAYFAISNSYQAVLMCPTEVLATQHYTTASKLYENFGVKVALLTGSMKKKERSIVVEKIARGEIDFIVGTHAVFSEDVNFKNLSLVITDEQHRFGVNQRSALENKTENADIIVMSATPIPRTLALTMYGQLSFSTIKTLPKTKGTIYTRHVPFNKESDMWKYLKDKADMGEQAFIVCPRIDEEDDELISAVALYNEKKDILKDQIGLLHGKLKEETKSKIMQDFVDGKIKILISTTVIEVGIDVKNATTMVIYNAERFGLSQLHQLRGRVGRGQKDGYCFLLTANNSPSVEERMDYFVRCSDGFELAEYDFSVRGGGDFIGTGQHGKSGDFAMSIDNIVTAKRISDVLLKDRTYREIIEHTITENRFEYFKNITLN